MATRLLIVSCAVVICLTGCVHPGQMARAAQFNQTNVEHLTEAYASLIGDFGAKLRARLDVQEAVLVADVQKVMLKYWDPGSDALKRTDLKNDVRSLQDAFSAKIERVSPEEGDRIRKETALANPVIGDVVTGYMSPSDANDIIKMFGMMQKNRSALAASVRKDAAKKVYVLRDFYQARQDILDQFAKYEVNAQRMMNEVKEAATAFVEFSKSRTNMLDGVELLKDQTVQKTIVDLVHFNTKDPQRRDAAQRLLDSLNGSEATVQAIAK